MKRSDRYSLLAAVSVILAIVLLASLREPVSETPHPVPASSGVPSGSGVMLSTPWPTESAIPKRSAYPSASPALVVPTKKPTPASHRSRRVVSGLASTYGPGYAGLTALPDGPGYRVRVCGRTCVTRVSNDLGPSKRMQRQGRIIDLDLGTFEKVCRCSWRTGLVRVTVEYLS